MVNFKTSSFWLKVPAFVSGDTFSVGDNSWLSVGSSNITAWVSQVSGSFTRIWGKNNGTHEDSRYLDAGSDEDFENGGSSNIAVANLKVFSYAQLIAATNNFGRDMVVGRGGFGKVYKGWQKEMVPSMGIKKSAIAVKKLGTASRQGFQQWQVCAFGLSLQCNVLHYVVNLCNLEIF
jgi:hypothetical protein